MVWSTAPGFFHAASRRWQCVTELVCYRYTIGFCSVTILLNRQKGTARSADGQYVLSVIFTPQGFIVVWLPPAIIVIYDSLRGAPRSASAAGSMMGFFSETWQFYKSPPQPIVFSPRLAVPLGSSRIASVFLSVNTCIRLIYTFGNLFATFCIYFHCSHFSYMHINSGYSYIPALYSHFCAYTSELSVLSAHYWQYP